MTPVKRSRQDRDGHVELRIPPSTGVFDWKRRCDSGPDSDTLEAPTINDHVGDSQEKQTIIAHEKSPAAVQHHNFRSGPEQLRSALVRSRSRRTALALTPGRSSVQLVSSKTPLPCTKEHRGAKQRP